MLKELSVENLLLIERARLELAPGLNVLTGETGAGKTVLAHALDLLMGGRPRAGIVRPGAAEAYVEGVFALPAELRREECLSADADEVVLARRVGADGRTRAYLNGRTAAVGDLRALGERLVAFYGQHEHRKLTLAAAQLEILDGFCGPAQAGRLRECAQAHHEVRHLEGSWRACASWETHASASSICSSTSWPRSTPPRRRRARRSVCAPRASAYVGSMRCASPLARGRKR
jgi:DNA repair protein RecN (Recombination protein N)